MLDRLHQPVPAKSDYQTFLSGGKKGVGGWGGGGGKFDTQARVCAAGSSFIKTGMAKN